MRKTILTVLLLTIIAPCLWAQRKELSQARSYIKSGKDFDKAEALMSGLLNDSDNTGNPKIYLMLYQAQRKQYDAGNEQLYLKQKYDTASLFNVTRRMFETLERLDSVDAAPDRHGNIKPKYRKKHAAELNQLRPNLFYGGTFFVRKGDYATAYDFFDKYIACASLPLFEGYNYATTDPRLPGAAFWATFCGQRLKNPALTLAHADLALKDTRRQLRTLRNMADAYELKKDTALYLDILRRGAAIDPLYPYFSPKLIDFYTAAGKPDSALHVADSALARSPRNTLFLFAKSTVLLAMGRNDDCLAISDTLIARNDTLPDIYYNAGMACLNKVYKLENAAVKDKKTIQALYVRARDYMERYRVLAPDDKKKWAPALYRIYLNLNMGRQFEEIDKLLNDK